MSRVKRFLFIFSAFLSAAVLCEAGLRIYFKAIDADIGIYRNFSFEREERIFMPDKILSYKLIPSVCRNAFTSDFQVLYCTNSIGLREKEIENTDKFKILFLGDSQTFGEGVPFGNRFSDLIERRIKNIYAINAGVPGYGIHQMFSWLKHYGLNLKPNLVICSILYPDLERAIYQKLEDSPHLSTKNQEREVSRNRIDSWISSFVARGDSWLERSYLYSVIRVRLKILRMLFHLKQRDREVWQEIRKEGLERLEKIMREGKSAMVREESFRIFLDFKDLLDQAQVRFLVVNIGRTSLPWLEAFFKKHAIDYLDLSPKLKSISKIRFEIDPHFNTKGHWVISDLLEDYISDRYKEDIAKIEQ